MPRKMIFEAVLVVALCGLVGCAPTLATRGNYLEDDKLKSFQVGVSTKDEVSGKIGSPTSTDPFDSNRWFYIGEKTSTKAFFYPKVLSRKIVTLTFDANNLLKNAQQTDGTNAKEIEMVRKTTPAPGREMNAFEQFLSNIGKFNQVPGASGNTPTQGR